MGLLLWQCCKHSLSRRTKQKHRAFSRIWPGRQCDQPQGHPLPVPRAVPSFYGSTFPLPLTFFHPRHIVESLSSTTSTLLAAPPFARNRQFPGALASPPSLRQFQHTLVSRQSIDMVSRTEPESTWRREETAGKGEERGTNKNTPKPRRHNANGAPATPQRALCTAKVLELLFATRGF